MGLINAVKAFQKGKKGHTIETDTAGAAAAGEWLSAAGFLFADRPRPPATPRCQPAGDESTPAHLLASASGSQTLFIKVNLLANLQTEKECKSKTNIHKFTSGAACFLLFILLSLICETANELADPINEALRNPFDIPLQNNNIRNRAGGARLFIL